MVATNIVGINLVDLKITFVGKLTYRAEDDLQTFELKTTRLKTMYGNILMRDRGIFLMVSPFDIHIGSKKQQLNWNNVIAYGNASKSGNAFCVPSIVNSTST
mmetsp:Transcript_50337/g.56251  ORF Transcript_50337/g.56251 Transcript_50337/m.56251 type:complete len:102 (+) Transcript_50337:1071-1376(+)